MTLSSGSQKKKSLTKSRSDEAVHVGASNHSRTTMLGDNLPRPDERVCSNQEDSLAAAVATICDGGEQSSCSKRPRVTTVTDVVDGGGEHEVESPERACRLGGRRVEILSSAGSVNHCSGGLFQELAEQVASVPSGLSHVPIARVGMSRSSVRSTVRSCSSTGVITHVVNQAMESAVDIRGSCSINARSATSTLKVKMSSVYADPGRTVRQDVDELLSTASFHRPSDAYDADGDDSDNDAASTCLQYMQRVDTLESEVGSSNIATIASNGVGHVGVGCLDA